MQACSIAAESLWRLIHANPASPAGRPARARNEAARARALVAFGGLSRSVDLPRAARSVAISRTRGRPGRTDGARRCCRAEEEDVATWPAPGRGQAESPRRYGRPRRHARAATAVPCVPNHACSRAEPACTVYVRIRRGLRRQSVSQSAPIRSACGRCRAPAGPKRPGRRRRSGLDRRCPKRG
jgi:hypothetical protein